MKKILTLCAGVLLVFGLCACNGGDTPDIPGPGEQPDPEVIEPGPETGGEGGDSGEGGETQYVSLELVKDEYTLTEGDDPVKLEYNVNPLESDVNVTSSNVNTATVEQDSDGIWWITPVLAGYGDATLTVTASYEGYESDIRTATVKVQQAEEVSTVTGIKFAEESYELTVGTPKEFVYGTDIIFEGTGTHSQDFELSVDAEYANVITISGHTVTASEDIESATLTVTATGGDVVGEVKATTTISAAGGTVAPEVTGVEFVDDSGQTTSTFTIKLSTPTLDLSDHVKVSGTGDYSQEFTIALTDTNPSGCVTLSDNVLTAVSEGTATVTVTAGSCTATATVTIEDDNVYVDSISFALNSYELWTGEIDESHPEEMVVGVSVTYTDGSPSEDASAYSISIAQGGDSYVSYDETTKTLSAVSEGSTQITATSTEQKKDGSNATATVDVTVQHNDILVNEIHFSSETWEVKESTSFTIGPSGTEADVTVTTGPENADNSSWELSTDDTNITIGAADGNGVYTVTASALSTSGQAETASITVKPTSGKEDVSDTLSISIIAWDSDITYVNSITLNPTTKTINEGEEFTIGGTTGDNNVTVTVAPEDATDPTYTVTCASDLISVGDPDTDGVVTVTAKEGSGGEVAGGQTYDVVVTANDGHAQSSTLKLTVNRPESVPTDITVTGGDNLGLTSHNEADQSDADSINLRNTLTVTVIDQYNEEYTGTGGSEYTLSTSSNDLITLDDTTGVVTAVAGASGTATVTVTSVATVDGEPLTYTVSIAVTPKTYEVTSISVDPTSATVDWGGEYTPEVTFEPVYADDTGYSIAHSDGDTIFTINGTSLKHNGTAAGSETFTITADDTTNSASCTLTLSVEKELDEPNTVTFTGLSESYEKGAVIDNLNDYVSVKWEHDDELNHYEHDGYTLSFETGNADVISVSEDSDTWSATCVGVGTTTLTAVVTPDAQGATVVKSDAVSVEVVITATSIQRSGDTGETLSLVEGEVATLSVSILPEGHTDSVAITWSSNNSAVTVENTTNTSNTITAVSAGTATITASAGDLGTVTWTVTVTPKLTSYTLSFDIKFSGGDSIYPLPDGVTLYEQYGADTFWPDPQQLSGSGSDPYTLTFSTDTLPSAGSYTINVYASNPEVEEGYYWDHELGNTTWTITGNESGDATGTVTISSTYDSWYDGDDPVYPTYGDEEVNFYILCFDNVSTGDGSVMASSGNFTKIESDLSVFGGSTTSDLTHGSNSNAWNQPYMYNTTVGSATAGTSAWFTFEGSSNYYASTGTITIPDNESGYAVYYGVVNTSDEYPSENMWDCQWATGVQDIDAFASSFSSWVS